MSPKLLVWITTVVSLLILENRFPFFKFTNRVTDRIITNFSLGLLDAIASTLSIFLATKYTATSQPQAGIISAISSPLLAGILSFLILDLYMYLWHRLMHTLPLPWRFHRLHHTDLYMNVSTAYRFHPIEVIVSMIPKLILIWWLGISGNFALTYELVFTVIVALHHSNLALPDSLDRLLANIIVTPNYHRIHHSQIIAETNSNYGSVFTWWDRIFGSYRQRSDIDKIALGVDDETSTLNLWQLVFPKIL
jgi:sterol desaturase/sphingolipid hydroxylase (fatty acid hydroxylase superfamily)